MHLCIDHEQVNRSLHVHLHWPKALLESRTQSCAQHLHASMHLHFSEVPATRLRFPRSKPWSTPYCGVLFLLPQQRSQQNGLDSTLGIFWRSHTTYYRDARKLRPGIFFSGIRHTLNHSNHHIIHATSYRSHIVNHTEDAPSPKRIHYWLLYLILNVCDLWSSGVGFAKPGSRIHEQLPDTWLDHRDMSRFHKFLCPDMQSQSSLVWGTSKISGCLIPLVSDSTHLRHNVFQHGVLNPVSNWNRCRTKCSHH